jgi:hypothetical protein
MHNLNNLMPGRQSVAQFARTDGSMVKEKVVEGSIHTVVDVVGKIVLEGLDGVSDSLTNDTRNRSFSGSSQNKGDVKSWISIRHFGHITASCSRTTSTDGRGIVVKYFGTSDNNSSLHSLHGVRHSDGIIIGCGFLFRDYIQGLSKNILKRQCVETSIIR